MTSARVLLLSGLVAGACAQSVQKVMVGQGGLKFVPDTLTGSAGDQIEFHFVSAGHSVVEGDFANPCQPVNSSAFFSGFVSPNTTPFTITLTSSDPVWFYCSAPGHCSSGMAGVINAPSGETIDDYANAAMSVQSAGAPDNVQGGVLASATMAMASSSMAASSSMMMTSSSAASAPAMSTAASSSMASMSSSAAMSTMASSSAAMSTAASGSAATMSMTTASPGAAGTIAPFAGVGAAGPFAGVGAAAGLLVAVAGMAL